MNKDNTLTLDGREVRIDNERNLLELIRKANIELPTFCYHSELSVYGACRLCIVDIAGMGIVTSCSTAPKPGMVVKTQTGELREMRKMYLELMLANHHQNCTTCSKSNACKLQDLSRTMGVTDIRFKPAVKDQPIDDSNPSLVRDPNKCILCGDCVRACSEIQGIGAIDFAFRGSSSVVAPAFCKGLDKGECVYCGLCASVCPTGAIIPKSEIDAVWAAINDPAKKVVVQIAPAVRVAIGELFGHEAGSVTTGRLVAAIKMLGVDKVFDTSFAADLTVMEETNEFIQRKTSGGKLPLFTSCCPAWVKYCEQFYPDLLGNVSTCRSPQQMFGSFAKKVLPGMMNVRREDLFVVSVMPCTAKKFEAARPEFVTGGSRDVDAVLTTQELARMISQAGIRFNNLSPESLDMPLGFKTGAGVIFGSSGGVSEAVLRHAAEKLTGRKLDNADFSDVRGTEGIRERTVRLGETELKLVIVHSLANAKKIADKVIAGECDYDFIEVMACPGGCIAGAGQPVSADGDCKAKRAAGLYETDKMLQLHKSHENPYISRYYEDTLDGVGGHEAHKLLHTGYQSRRRLFEQSFSVMDSRQQGKLAVSVCAGTSCYLRGSQRLLRQLVDYVAGNGLEDMVDVRATFCFEACEDGPNASVGDVMVNGCTLEKIVAELKKQLAQVAN